MPKYKVFAAIDFGSTQISMKIASISSNGIDETDRVRYEIPAGKEVYTSGKISYETVEKICSCFEKLIVIMRSYGVEAYSCYATSAIREAKNSEYIIDQINIKTGIKVNIISNEEERFLHNKALALNNGAFDDIIEKGALIADIGSGSMQASYYKNSLLRFSQKIPLGALRVLELLSTIDPNSVSFNKVLENYINVMLDRCKRNYFENADYKYFVIVSGQISTVKRLINVDSTVITYEQLINAYNLLRRTNPEAISDELGISYEEAQLLLPSVIMFKYFIDNKKDTVIIDSGISMMDGMCVEYAEKNKYTHTKHIFTNDIISSAAYCAARYKVDEAHNDAVISYCESIFSAMAKRFGLSKRNLNVLKIAAIFADTGRYINTNSHFEYSYDIVMANPILGVSQRETEEIACIVYCHTLENIESSRLSGLSKSRRLLVSKLTAILALAKALDCEYSAKIAKNKIKTSFRDGALVIKVSTDEDIALEKRQFDIAANFFEEVFGIRPKLKVSKN